MQIRNTPAPGPVREESGRVNNTARPASIFNVNRAFRNPEIPHCPQRMFATIHGYSYHGMRGIAML
jgi:hypothetical protein